MCPTLCDPMNYTVHGILQARTLEWVAVAFSRESSQARNWAQVCATPVLLPGKSHGRRSLVYCSPWGRESQRWLSDFTFTFLFHALEKEMANHSSVLAWRIAGTAEPSGLRSMGLQRVGHDWSDLAAAAAPTLQGYSLPAKPPEKPVDKYEWINQGHQYDRILFNFLKEYILEYLIICAILMTHYFKIMYAVIDI